VQDWMEEVRGLQRRIARGKGKPVEQQELLLLLRWEVKGYSCVSSGAGCHLPLHSTRNIGGRVGDSTVAVWHAVPVGR
jgi:hypothetical protein